MHEVHTGSFFRLTNDPAIKFSEMGQCLMYVFGWAYRGSTDFLARTICELRGVSLFHYSMYIKLIVVQ